LNRSRNTLRDDRTLIRSLSSYSLNENNVQDAQTATESTAKTQKPLTDTELRECRTKISQARQLVKNAFNNVKCCPETFDSTKYCSAQGISDRLSGLLIDVDNTSCGDTWGYTKQDGKWKIWVCPDACRWGKWTIGFTILHELYHECQPGATEPRCDKAGYDCSFKNPNDPPEKKPRVIILPPVIGKAGS